MWSEAITACPIDDQEISIYMYTLENCLPSEAEWEKVFWVLGIRRQNLQLESVS